MRFVQNNCSAPDRLINTLLQRGDREGHGTATALAVSRLFGEIAEAVRYRAGLSTASLK